MQHSPLYFIDNGCVGLCLKYIDIVSALTYLFVMKRFLSISLFVIGFISIIPMVRSNIFNTPKLTLSTVFLKNADISFEKKLIVTLFAYDKISFQHTLTSVLKQEYDNFRIVIFMHINLDPKEINTLCQRFNKEHIVDLITINYPKEFLEKYNQWIQQCQDLDIIVQLSGSDWLNTYTALQQMNKVYAQSDSIWLTYPDALSYPSFTKIKHKKYKFFPTHHKIPYFQSPLKTYYAGLAKQVSLYSNTTTKHKILENNLDIYLLPMIHAAKNHIHHIDKPLLIHNTFISN